MRTQISNMFYRFCRDEDGASMVEYAVALLVVTAVGVGTLTVLGENTGAIATLACTEVGAAATGAGGTASAGTC